MAEGFLAETGKEPEEPEPEVHELDGKIGYCPDCDDLHVDGDLSSTMEHGNVSEALRESMPDHTYICADCGVPMAKDRDEAEDLEECWFCGSKRAVNKEVLEEE